MVLPLFITLIRLLLSPVPAQSHTPIRILFLGDSLTDGYGIAREAAFPILIEKKLKALGHPEIEVIPAGISGSTAAGAEKRLKWQINKKPQILVLELGANDGLRGLPLSEIKSHLSQTITLAQKEHIEVLLVGMKIPPNYGKKYTDHFEALYTQLAQKFKIKLIPFLLEGIANHPELNQEDQIHPNEKGHQKIADQVTPYLEKMILKYEKHLNR